MKNTIYHHGVKGMRWGIRRNTKNANPNKRTKKKLSPTTKKAIRVAVQIGTSIVGRMLIQKYIINNRSTSSVISSGKTAANKVWAGKGYQNLTMDEMRKLDLAF